MLNVVANAVFYSGCYVVWLLAFERWLEPSVRRVIGAVLGLSIAWVPACGWLRAWGMRDRDRADLDVVASLLGGIFILCAALVPAVAVGMFFGAEPATETRIACTRYFILMPMIALFALHVFSGRPETK